MPDDTAAVQAAVDEAAAPVVVEKDKPEAPQEPETVSMPKAEADAWRRRVAESEKALRKVEADRKKAEEERQAEQGKWKELAEQRDRELASERGERARVQREQRITRLAVMAKFIDPTDAIGRITAEEGDDDSSTEAALQRIAERSPHLIAKEEPPRPEIGQVHAPAAGTPGTPAEGKPAPPPGKAPLTAADLETISQAEAVIRMDEVDWLLKQLK